VAAPVLDRLLELTRDADEDVRREAAEALNRIMASGVRIYKLPGWKRFFRRDRVASLEELDPEQPSTS
jgi:HEAT repeat protein